MKLKKILTLAIVLFAFSFFANAQVEQAEAPMFSTIRHANKALTHDFAKVSGKSQSYQFKIKNEGETVMQIVDIKIPERVGVTLINKTIKKGEEGIINITIDPTNAEKGKFAKKITIITKQLEPGITTTKEITFRVTGTIE